MKRARPAFYRVLLVLLMMLTSAVLTAGPQRLLDAVHQILSEFWARGAKSWAKQDLQLLTERLAADSAKLKEVEKRRQELARELNEHRKQHDACQKELAEDREVLKEIAGLLSQSGKLLEVNGVSFARAVIESDAEKHLQKCQGLEAKRKQLEPRITELSSALQRLDQALAHSKQVLAFREEQLKSLKLRADTQELREEVARLSASVPGDEGWGQYTQRIESTISAESAKGGGSGSTSPVTERIASYLQKN